MTPEQMEGRLTAQRRLIALILTRPELRDAALALIEAREMTQTGEEDPGVLPDPAFAITAATNEEYRLIRAEMDRFTTSGAWPQS